MRKYLIIPFLFAAVPLFTLSVNPASWNIGPVTREGVQTLKLEVSNDSSNPVKVSFVSTCGCLSSDPESVNLSSGESRAVIFRFNPEDESGRFSKFIIIRTDGKEAFKALFEVSGTVGSGDKKFLKDTPGSKNAEVHGYKTVDIEYYYSAGCSSCRHFLDKTIPDLEKKFDLNINVKSFDILDPAVYKRYLSLLSPDDRKHIAFPSVLIGGEVLQGDKEIGKNLEREILHYSEDKDKKAYGRSAGEISFSFVSVFTAGLLDGINPCVFSSLLFLVSSLVLAGRTKKEILVIGSFFTAAVFTTYYLIGLGIFQGLRTASLFPVAAKVIRWLLFSSLLLISVLSLYDFIKIRRGRVSEVSLQLPMFLKLKIHSAVRRHRTSPSLIAGSVFLGASVSVFELACTGQVYFPTIAYLIAMGNISAYFYLFIYNTGFTIPLIVVFSLVYRGAGTKIITEFFKSHMDVMKISISLLFLVLAVATVFVL